MSPEWYKYKELFVALRKEKRGHQREPWAKEFEAYATSEVGKADFKEAFAAFDIECQQSEIQKRESIERAIAVGLWRKVGMTEPTLSGDVLFWRGRNVYSDILPHQIGWTLEKWPRGRNPAAIYRRSA